jgi:hypothetical protein
MAKLRLIRLRLLTVGIPTVHLSPRQTRLPWVDANKEDGVQQLSFCAQVRTGNDALAFRPSNYGILSVTSSLDDRRSIIPVPG